MILKRGGVRTGLPETAMACDDFFVSPNTEIANGLWKTTKRSTKQHPDDSSGIRCYFFILELLFLLFGFLLFTFDCRWYGAAIWQS